MYVGMIKTAARMEMDPWLSMAYEAPVFTPNYDLPDAYDLMSDAERAEKDRLDDEAFSAGMRGFGRWGAVGAGIGAGFGAGMAALENRKNTRLYANAVKSVRLPNTVIVPQKVRPLSYALAAGAYGGVLSGIVGAMTNAGEVRDAFMRRKLDEDPEYYHRIYGMPVGSRGRREK